MGKTRRKQKSIFDDDALYDLGVEDLIRYASNAKKRSGSRKKRENWEDEYFDYLDDETPNSPPKEKENK